MAYSYITDNMQRDLKLYTSLRSEDAFPVVATTGNASALRRLALHVNRHEK